MRSSCLNSANEHCTSVIVKDLFSDIMSLSYGESITRRGHSTVQISEHFIFKHIYIDTMTLEYCFCSKL